MTAVRAPKDCIVDEWGQVFRVSHYQEWSSGKVQFTASRPDRSCNCYSVCEHRDGCVLTVPAASITPRQIDHFLHLRQGGDPVCDCEGDPWCVPTHSGQRIAAAEPPHDGSTGDDR